MSALPVMVVVVCVVAALFMRKLHGRFVAGVASGTEESGSGHPTRAIRQAGDDLHGQVPRTEFRTRYITH